MIKKYKKMEIKRIIWMKKSENSKTQEKWGISKVMGKVVSWRCWRRVSSYA